MSRLSGELTPLMRYPMDIGTLLQTTHVAYISGKLSYADYIKRMADIIITHGV